MPKRTAVRERPTRTKRNPVEILLADPYRPPDWRFQRILQLLDGPTTGRLTRSDDAFIKGGRRYLALFRSRTSVGERRQLMLEYPGMFYAHKIYEKGADNNPIRFLLEARLLARMDFLEIANASGIPAEAVIWYEAVFFHVIPKLKLQDWIMTHVLQPAAARSLDDDEKSPAYVRTNMDWTLKLFAYYGGPLLCDFLISGFRQAQLGNLDDVHNYLDRCFADKIRLRSLQAANMFKIDRQSGTALFDAHIRLTEYAKQVKPGQATSEAVRGMLEIAQTIPWTAGEVSREVYKETHLAAYDDTAAELTEQELMRLTAGETPDFLKDLPELSITDRVVDSPPSE